MPQSLSDDPERLARFEREAQILAALNHPNIAHIHGFEDSSGAPALIMELGAANLFWQAADGTGAAERLIASPSGQNPKAVAPDGKRIVFTAIGDTASANDLHVLMLDGTPRTEPLIQTAFYKSNPAISPDGRWMAYESNESGQPEIYVRPFPNVNSGRWLVSSAGGRQPQWGRDGRELFYLDRTGFLTSVEVETKPTFASSVPNRVLQKRYPGGAGPWSYDIANDGQRFLMFRDAASPDKPDGPPLTWSASLAYLRN